MGRQDVSNFKGFHPLHLQGENDSGRIFLSSALLFWKHNTLLAFGLGNALRPLFDERDETKLVGTSDTYWVVGLEKACLEENYRIPNISLLHMNSIWSLTCWGWSPSLFFVDQETFDSCCVLIFFNLQLVMKNNEFNLSFWGIQQRIIFQVHIKSSGFSVQLCSLQVCFCFRYRHSYLCEKLFDKWYWICKYTGTSLELWRINIQYLELIYQILQARCCIKRWFVWFFYSEKHNAMDIN